MLRDTWVFYDNAQAHSSLGLLLWRQGDKQAALQEFRQAVLSDRDLPEGHYNIGLALAQLARFDEAARELNEAVSLNPKYTDARVQLGLVLNQKNDTAVAINVFRELIRREPNFAEAHNNLGLVYLQSSDLSAAQTEFLQAVRIKPGYAEAHYNLGLALERQGKGVEARAVRESVCNLAGASECGPSAMMRRLKGFVANREEKHAVCKGIEPPRVHEDAGGFTTVGADRCTRTV